MCLYHSKTLMVKQGIFLYEAWPDLAGRGIYLTQEIWNIILEICSLVNC